jgi:hypothetical protein
MVGFIVRSGYHIDGTRSAEQTQLNTKIRSKRNGRVEDELNSEMQPGKEAFAMLQQTNGGQEAIDKGFEIVPGKFSSSAEYEQNRTWIVNVSAAF